MGTSRFSRGDTAEQRARRSGEPRRVRRAPSWALRALHRPGHAEHHPGHAEHHPGHAERRLGPHWALCPSAESRHLHGSDRGHGGRRQCPEARGMYTARETPRGASRVLRQGQRVRKAMRRLWGCRRGPPSVGLLGGQALAPSGICHLPHAALSLREMPCLPQGPRQKPELPPGTLADSSWRPHPLPLATRSFCRGWGSHSGFLPALP